MVLLLLLLPSSTWLPAWLYSSYRFLPASLMVSLLFLPSVLPRNFIRAELYPFIFTEPLFFPGVRGTLFYLFPDTRNFSYWFTQLIAPVFGSHKISRNLITHFSMAQRKAGQQHTKDHYDIGDWSNSLVGTWLFNWESVGLGLPSWLDQFVISAVVHCEAALPEFGSILQPIFF